MTERDLERLFCQKIHDAGGLAWKFVSPGTRGVPDRLILFPVGKISFVEVKSKKGHLSALQKKRKEQIEALGFSYFLLNSKEQIKTIIESIKQ